MKICVLSSGSEGNCTYVETPNNKILVDIGSNVKYIKEKLSELSINLEDIDYVLISHTHADHVKALKTYIKKYKSTILITQKMYEQLPYLEEYENIIKYDDDILLDGLTIKTIKASHDAEDSRNFIFITKNSKACIVTDTGYINQKYFEDLKDLDLYIFESNHDVEMLMNGVYPQWLKIRVVGPHGHLSNKDSSVYLAKLIGPKTKQIILAHISQKNNTEEIAMETITETFKEYNIDFNNIVCAKQHEKGQLIEL